MKWLRIVLWVLLTVACIGLIIYIPSTISAYQTLQIEKNATPTPTADTSSMMLVTIDPNNTPTPTASVLKRGMESTAVSELQQALLDLGYYSGTVDGQYGDGTVEAVTLFQSQHGLDADGIAGEATLALLYSTSAETFVATPTPSPTPSVIKKGEDSDRVLAVQQRLQELGYYDGVLDGQFGGGTEEAVRLFQKQNDLDVDGVIGSQTLAAINDENASMITITPTPNPSTLPLLVNADHPLDSDYVPDSLVLLRNVLSSSLVYVKGSEIEGDETAADALNRMFKAAVSEGITGWQISSGYRSYAYQQELFDTSVNNLIAEGRSRESAYSVTRLTVADPGTSEHQTGLAFDITVADTTFAGTQQQIWLHEYCWDYGFIVRYQEDKEDITGYIAEAWHIRYVGTQHSLVMKNNNWCLEEYIEAMEQ